MRCPVWKTRVRLLRRRAQNTKPGRLLDRRLSRFCLHWKVILL